MGVDPERATALLRVADVLGIVPLTTVVELGAGTGTFTSVLSETLARVVAVESDEANRARLAPAVPSAEIVNGSADRIPLPEWTADVVVVCDPVIPEDAMKAAVEVERVLRPGGRFGLVSTRTSDEEWAAWRDALANRPALGPLKHQAGPAGVEVWWCTKG